MIKIKLIRGIINISSIIQTSLINYLEFHQREPRELKENGYGLLKHPPEKPEEIPKPFQKEDVIKPHYKILLKIAEEQGREIKPLNRRFEPLRTKQKHCRKCHAPPEYLRNHGFYIRKSTREKFPKHTCKICLAEYAPQAARKKAKHICPYCGYGMNPKNYHKNFTLYCCRKFDCAHPKLHPTGKRYNEREWHFEYDKLEVNGIHEGRSLEKIRISKNILDLEMSLFIECGITSRETIKILQKVYGNEVMKSHQSVLNHAQALAAYIKTNEKHLPVSVGKTVCEDETYIKYHGRWGYLFRAINPYSKALIAEHFSVHRDTKGAITLNKGVIEKYLQTFQDPEFQLITDSAPIYPAAISYLEEKGKAKIKHYPVTGIFDRPDEKNSKFRSEKQIIERSFESLKSEIKRRRGFSSFQGVEIFCYLHMIYYNHLRPHRSLENQPPLPLNLGSGNRVKNWHQLLQYLSEKQR